MAIVTDTDGLHTVSFYRNGTPIPVEDNPFQIAYDKRLDDIGEGVVSYAVASKACCEQLALLEPWSDTMAVWKDVGGETQLRWYGWISTEVKYTRDRAIIRANDAMVWFKKRIINTDHAFAGADLSTILAALFVDAIDIDNPGIVLDTTPTGVLADREYFGTDFRYSWPSIKELLNTGLDATALGQRIVAGVLDFGTIEMNATDFIGDINLTKAGGAFGTRHIVKGNNGIVGIVGGTTGNPPYPLVDDVIDDSNILDQASADAAAQTRADFNKVVPRVFDTPANAKIILCDEETFKRLVPGTRVNLNSAGLCYERTETYRLSKVNVVVQGRSEDVGVTLAPVGSDNLVA